MIKIVIFDLDGTLLDTIDDLADASNYVMTHYGYPQHTIDEYKYKVGNGMRKLVERAMPEEHRTCAEVDAALSIFMPYYGLHKTDKTKPYKGITELLMTLQEHGVAIAVATNKAQKAVEELMKTYFPEIKFTAVIGQTDKMPIKPHPAIVNEIMRITSAGCNETLYVGDSDVDMQTAINANVEACAVTWGFRTREELQSYKPKHIVDNPCQILTICGISAKPSK